MTFEIQAQLLAYVYKPEPQANCYNVTFEDDINRLLVKAGDIEIYLRRHNINAELLNFVNRTQTRKNLYNFYIRTISIRFPDKKTFISFKMGLPERFTTETINIGK